MAEYINVNGKVLKCVGTIHGEKVYVETVKHWRGWETWRKIKLFCGIVWRDFHGVRVSWNAAHDVVQIVWRNE